MKGNTVNWDMIESDWTQFEDHVRQKWAKLADVSLALIVGRRDQLSGKLQEAYGITKDQADRQLREFEVTHKDFQPKSQT